VNEVKVNLTGLRTLQRQVVELEAQHAEVGLLAETSGRSSGRGKSNPDIGFVHEFGSVLQNIPERSFIRMPLMVHLGNAVSSGIDWFRLLKFRGVKFVLAKLGVVAEDLIQEGFATGGYGTWPALRPATIRRKNSSAILIESAQMRKAVTSRVV
jgi:hypothetical protein